MVVFKIPIVICIVTHAVCLLAGSWSSFLFSVFRISESALWPQASPLWVPSCVLGCMATTWVTDPGSLILQFDTSLLFTAADSANCRYCPSLGSVFFILLFWAEPSGRLILSYSSFPFFIAFHYFCGRHSDRQNRYVFLLFFLKRNLGKSRREGTSIIFPEICSLLSLW